MGEPGEFCPSPRSIFDWIGLDFAPTPETPDPGSGVLLFSVAIG